MKESTRTKLAIIELKDSIKASCEESTEVCSNCDCWIDLLDGEPVDGCDHDVTIAQDEILLCVQCDEILESSELLNEYLLKNAPFTPLT